MNTSEPVVIEKIFSTNAETIWNALTDKDQMKQWYFELAEFKPEVGFEFTFVGGTEQNTYVHLCEVTEVVLNKKLTHSWRYEGFEGESFVTWELLEEGVATKLRLTHAGLETFPSNNADFAKGNFVEGWNYIIGTSLENFLNPVNAT